MLRKLKIQNTLDKTIVPTPRAAKAGAPAPTVDLRVDYHRAAKPGDLRAVGRIVRMGGTFSTAEAEVFDGDDKLIASGRGLYFTGALKQQG